MNQNKLSYDLFDKLLLTKFPQKKKMLLTKTVTKQEISPTTKRRRKKEIDAGNSKHI